MDAFFSAAAEAREERVVVRWVRQALWGRALERVGERWGNGEGVGKERRGRGDVLDGFGFLVHAAAVGSTVVGLWGIEVALEGEGGGVAQGAAGGHFLFVHARISRPLPSHRPAPKPHSLRIMYVGGCGGGHSTRTSPTAGNPRSKSSIIPLPPSA